MRAVVVRQFGEPSVLQVEEVATPSPGPGEVLVRVRAAGVNPVDTYIRAGLGAAQALPYTPGEDASGDVAELGQGTGPTGLSIGQRVYLSGSISGTYADYTLCRPEHVHPLPDRCSYAQGAAVGVPYGTAYRALFQKAAAQAGETVLVHGASGGVGLAAVQLAVAAGITAIGSASSAAGRRLVENAGATHVVDHSRDDHFEAVLELTQGRGVDVILEMRSDLNLGRDLPLLAAGGRVVCVGNRGPRNEGTVAINARDLMRRDGTILGMLLPDAGHPDMASLHAALVKGLASGELRPVIARELPLERAAEAHRLVMAGPALGKTVLVP